MKKPLLILVLLLLSACTQPKTDQENAISVESPTPEATTDYMQELILAGVTSSFSDGPHAAVFSCDKCHSVKDDLVEKELIWVDEITHQAESLATSTELCAKCHPNQYHQRRINSSTSMVHSEFECTTCHQSHNTQASCTQSTCHSNIRDIILAEVEIPDMHPASGATNQYMCGGSSCHELAKQALASPIYHQPVHRQVPCYVCHDVSGLSITVDINNSWFTIRDALPGVNPPTEESVSHQIGRKVDCIKCHYTDNPWMLVDHLASNR